MMFKAAIWANKNDSTFTLWAVNAPDYEISSNLKEGVQRLIDFGVDNIRKNSGTFLCSIKDVGRTFQLGTLNFDGSISWSIKNVEDLFEGEFPELVNIDHLEKFANDEDLYLLVVDNASGEVIYQRELKNDDLLDIDSYLPEIEGATELSLDTKSIQAGLGQLNISISYSTNPQDANCWDSKDYFLTQTIEPDNFYNYGRTEEKVNGYYDY